MSNTVPIAFALVSVLLPVGFTLFVYHVTRRRRDSGSLDRLRMTIQRSQQEMHGAAVGGKAPKQ